MFKKFICFLVSIGMLALTTGCASGGFSLTRKYARFVNGQNIIIRIILYILTGVVFAVTMLIDLVIFNTIDFWEGRVSQGTYHFEKDGMKYAATHEFQEGTKLKKSTILITEVATNKIQKIQLLETPKGEVEFYLDGKLKTKASSISEFPIISQYDDNGTVISRMPVNLKRKLLALAPAKPHGI